MLNPTLSALGSSLLALVLAGCGGETDAPAPAEPQVSISDARPAPAPSAEARFQTLDGEPATLADWRGSKIFLNYWATWCAPCIEEIPAILRAEQALADEGYVFLLASDESLEEIRDFLAEQDFDGNFIKLEGYFGSQGVQAVPSTVLYDENGAQVNSWLGAYEWDSEEMLAEIRSSFDP